MQQQRQEYREIVGICWKCNKYMYICGIVDIVTRPLHCPCSSASTLSSGTIDDNIDKEQASDSNWQNYHMLETNPSIDIVSLSIVISKCLHFVTFVRQSNRWRLAPCIPYPTIRPIELPPVRDCVRATMPLSTHYSALASSHAVVRSRAMNWNEKCLNWNHLNERTVHSYSPHRHHHRLSPHRWTSSSALSFFAASTMHRFCKWKWWCEHRIMKILDTSPLRSLWYTRHRPNAHYCLRLLVRMLDRQLSDLDDRKLSSSSSSSVPDSWS